MDLTTVLATCVAATRFICILRRMILINHHFALFPVLSVKNVRSLTRDLSLANRNPIQQMTLKRFIGIILTNKNENLKHKKN